MSSSRISLSEISELDRLIDTMELLSTQNDPNNQARATSISTSEDCLQDALVHHANFEPLDTSSTALPTSVSAPGPSRIHESNGTNPKINPSLWTSPWLNKKILFGFTTLFTLLWIGLIVLWQFDARNNGIRMTLSTSHYAWTYGPTAIITIVVILWRRVEYHCKLIQPWKELRDHTLGAPQNLLLDYISPLQFVTLFKSLRNRHWLPALGVLTFFLLKLAILFSTALLISSPTSDNNCPAPITIDSKFNTTALWATIGSSDLHVFKARSQFPAYDRILPAPIYAYEGVIKKQRKELPGIQGGIVFQTFTALPTAQNITRISTNVRAFIPNITCEAARVVFRNDTSTEIKDLTVDSPSCSAGHFGSTLWISTCIRDCPSWDVKLEMFRVNCSEGPDATEPTIENTDKYGSYDLRFAFLVANFSYVNYTMHNLTSWYAKPVQSEAVLCKFDYHIQDIRVARDTETRLFMIDEIIPSLPHSQLSNLTGTQFGEFLFSLLSEFDEGLPKFGEFLVELSRPETPRPPSTMYLDAESMAKAAPQVLGGIGAHLLQERCIVTDNVPANGTGVCYENRLHVHAVTLWGLVSIFILASAFPILMACLSADSVVSLNPCSIVTHGTVLAHSPALQQLLGSAGSLPTNKIQELLEAYIFRTGINKFGHFQVIPTPQKDQTGIQQRDEVETTRMKREAWLPFAAGYPFLALTFLFPILGIVSLEILYQVSKHNDGFTQRDNIYLPYVPYLTSLVALTVATTFNSVDFVVQSFSHFHALSRGRIMVERDLLLLNFLDFTPPVALYQALRKRHFGTGLSNIASSIGGLLTIISSGLWVLKTPVPITVDAWTSLATAWDLKWTESLEYDGGASTLLNSIDLNASVTPEGIWNDLVFPDIHSVNMVHVDDTREFTNSNVAAPPYLTFTLPALRPELICKAVPKENVHYELIDVETHQIVEYWVDLSGQLTKGCFGDLNSNRNPQILTYDGEFEGELYNGSPSIAYDLLLADGPGNSFSRSNSDSWSQGGIEKSRNSSYDCPSIGIVYSLNDFSTAVQNASILLCWQKIQEVQVEVTMRANATTHIGQQSLLSPPRVNESTAMYMANDSNGAHSFSYKIIEHLETNLNETGPRISYYLDRFFQHVAYGTGATPLENMVGPENIPNLINAVNRLYKRYMVEVINTPIFRKQLNESQLQNKEVYNGTATIFVSRLTVDYTSKLILQILLATMSVIMALALTQVRLRGLLPRSPYDIASVMALLAGTKLCTEGFILEGVEHMNEKQLKEVLGAHEFGMGWRRRHQGDPLQAEGSGENEVCDEDLETWRFGIDVGRPVRPGFRLRDRNKKWKWKKEKQV